MPLVPELVRLVQHLKDPNKKRREEVQNLALSDPQFADRLKNVLESDPSALDKLYKKDGLEQFIRGQPESASAIADKAKASEANRIRGLQARDLIEKNPDNVANAGVNIKELDKLNITPAQAMKPLDKDERSTLDEFRANASGTKTSKERELTQAGIDANNQQQKYFKTELDKTEKEEADKKEYTRIATAAVARLKKKGSTIYDAKKKGELDSGEVTAINAVPAFRKQYEDEFEEFWKNQQMNEQKDAHNKTLQEMKAQSEDLLARKTADETDGAVSYDNALKLVRNPNLLDAFSNEDGTLKKLDDLPNRTPEVTQLWNAARFYKDKQDKAGKAAFAKAQLAFQSNPVYKKFFGDKKKDDWSEDEIKELNDAAKVSYMSEGFLEAPQYKREEIDEFGINRHKAVLESTPKGAEGITGKPASSKKKGGANVKEAPKTAGDTLSIPDDFDYDGAAKELANNSDDEIKKELKKNYPELKDGQILQMLTRLRGKKK